VSLDWVRGTRIGMNADYLWSKGAGHRLARAGPAASRLRRWIKLISDFRPFWRRATVF